MTLHTVLDKSRYETDQKAQIQETGDLSTITKQNKTTRKPPLILPLSKQMPLFRYQRDTNWKQG